MRIAKIKEAEQIFDSMFWSCTGLNALDNQSVIFAKEKQAKSGIVLAGDVCLQLPGPDGLLVFGTIKKME